MASLSDKLKQERELRGVSLKQISDETKIGVRFLEALEEDQLERIPGEFYRRSYLRAYARYLGLDEDRAINAYDYSQRELASAAAGKHGPSSSERTPVSPNVKWAAMALLGLTSGALVWSSVRSNESSSSDPPAVTGDSVGESTTSSPGSQTNDAGASSPAAVMDEGGPLVDAEPARAAESSREPSESEVAGPLHGSEPRAGPLKLVISVDEACWLEVRSDGVVAAEGLKPEGFTQAVYADEEIRLWLGNAGGVSLSINDRAVKPLGRSGQVRKDLSITPDNFHEYLAAADLTQ